MGALDALANNHVSDLLAMESNLPYARDATMFFFVLHVLRSSKAGSSFLATFVLTFVRAFGAIGFALPLVLGGLPGDILKGMDHNGLIVFCAMAWDHVNIMAKAPKAVNDVLGHVENLSYSVVKANVCAQGYAAAGSALGGSFWAPFVGAFVAVQGASFIEGGVNSINSNTFNEDGLLGLLGGVWLWLGANHLDVTGSMARVCLAAFHFSNEWVDHTGNFANFLNQVDDFVSNVGTGNGGKRSRSRTPTRKNK